ncbi:MAG: hypothetical protein LWY06_05630 [Firmicutes bacterium]|nr:hypothetical protein [Bacillota bacterium]
MNTLILYKSVQTPEKNTSVGLQTLKSNFTSGKVVIEAYMDKDSKNEEGTVWFEIDGVGGFVGCEKELNGEAFGEGVIKKGATKTWTYDLSKIKYAPADKPGQKTVNMIELLNDKKSHTVKCWVNGGSKSHVTVKIIAK